MDFVWEKQAAMGEPMPSDLSLSEQKAYQAMAFLYFRYYAKTIDKEQAAEDKRRIKSRLQNEFDMEVFQNRVACEREKVLRLSERARVTARKNPNRENCILLADTIDGIQKNEFQQDIVLSEDGAHCPCCNKILNHNNELDKPRFCENCGTMLKWEAGSRVYYDKQNPRTEIGIEEETHDEAE